MAQYVALLRGINVGRKNIIKMTELKHCFEDMGFESVTTYIQNGNVLFKSTERSNPKLTQQIENALAKKLKYKVSVVVCSLSQIQKIVRSAQKILA